MKKTYEKPYAEKVEFDYKTQVVAASGSCIYKWINGGNPCSTEQIYSKINN